MARIPRKTQKLYASSAGATGITEYGSPASGTPIYSTDLDDIQTTAWLTGWSAAALSGGEIPTFQDFNAIHYVFANQLGYLLQEGIPEYDSGTEYHQNSIVRKSGTYELYGSKVNTNTGNALPSQVDNTNWQYLGDLANIGATFATSAEIRAGTENAKAVTPLGINETILGMGQTLQDVSASRAAGTTYTNSTGKPIFVSISITSGSSLKLFLVDSVAVGRNSLNSGINVSFIVPNGSTYSFESGSGSAIVSWTELR